ncbi:uncharacterized protein LOC105702211 [Orussus abietinus]|uniref:uncharacterized protein LOC105702211 n=1 Tax=Orussus abietinus TaxID=222816 RepID=UPI000625AB44|nr:uncharacterized protein LOC105702211 [Orussus abietinus]XP_012285017.1 uncharacterized protein LOC105702211 [Orussus abietinus]
MNTYLAATEVNMEIKKGATLRSKNSIIGILVVMLIIATVGNASHGDQRFSEIEEAPKIGKKRTTPLHKAILTQRGYIQFLRWDLPVPEIKEFTFCLWIKSTNFTYSHPIFSYSKNEKDRLVRSWISPDGTDVNLEIDNVEIFSHPVFLKEHIWYHVCQSWDNSYGRYGVWIDGHLVAEGYSEKMVGHVIPSKGDIVLGQEYTDFDEGLEDGIEGAILGFNLVLASAFEKSGINFPKSPSFSESFGKGTEFPYPLIPTKEPTINHGAKPSFPGNSKFVPTKFLKTASDLDVATIVELIRKAKSSPENLKTRILQDNPFPGNIHPLDQSTRISEFDHDFVPIYTDRSDSAGFGDHQDSTFHRNQTKWTYSESPEGRYIVHRRRTRSSEGHFQEEYGGESYSDRGTEHFKLIEWKSRPLGLQLMELTYHHCLIGRGSPSIGGSLMLISWTRTPVQVFGGAIIKNARSQCGKFG